MREEEAGHRRLQAASADDDPAGWFDAAHNPLREKMEREHPWRWARLLRDLRWIRKEMVKLGMNPNDLKWWVR